MKKVLVTGASGFIGSFVCNKLIDIGIKVHGIDNMNKYVHGYSDYEANRLHDQADSLSDLLHYDSVWEKGSIILEAGCGIGAQTKIVAPKNKYSKFISIDISLESLDQARKVADSNNINNVLFQEANIFVLKATYILNITNHLKSLYHLQ